MSNFYKDNPDIEKTIDAIDLSEVAALCEEGFRFAKEYDLQIIDRVGGGDSFGGGLIYALASGKGAQAAIDFAVAASALKHSVEGDFNHMTVSEVEALAAGNGTGRVQR
jgi:2-dehydro-3-deoxygluconokinase